MDARRIVNQLLTLRTTQNKSLIQQLASLTERLQMNEDRILATEREVDDYVFSLYELTKDERATVEAGTEQRVNARIPRGR